MNEDAEAVARAELMMHLRSRNAAGRAVLAAIETIPRALFLPAGHKSLAYQDRAVPIDCGQTISQPTVVAMMTEALELEPHHRVLEIGTGSGYQTAVLCRLARHVVSLERFKLLSQLAQERLSVLSITNATLAVADGRHGWPEEGPFDRILITAATPAIPAALTKQMTPGAIIVAPLGEPDGEQSLVKAQLVDGALEGEALADVRFVPLVPGVANAL